MPLDQSPHGPSNDKPESKSFWVRCLGWIVLSVSTCWHWLKSDSIQWLKVQMRRHLTFAVVAFAAYYVLQYVPQIRNLRQPPPLVWKFSELLRYFQFILFIGILIWFYIPSIGVLRFWRDSFEDDERILPGTSATMRLLRFPAELSAGWLNGFLGNRASWLRRSLRFQSSEEPAFVKTVKWGRRLTATLTFFAGSAGFLFGRSVESSNLYMLSGVACRVWSTLFMVIGLWCWWPELKAAFRRGRDADARLPGKGWTAIGRVAAWYTVSVLIGELFWLSAWGVPGISSYRLYTIWAVFHLLAMLIIFASLVDYLHIQTAIPARQLAFVVVIVWGIYQGPRTVWDAGIVESSSAMVQDISAVALPEAQPVSDAKGNNSASTWHRHMYDRIQKMPPGPAVIVAASGGGSRAALFTALVLEGLTRTPMELLPFLPSNGAIESADADNDDDHLADSVEVRRASESASRSGESTWADHIALISGVSGGCLAAAYHVTHDDYRAEVRSPLHHSTRPELLHHAQEHIRGYLEDSKKSTLNAEQAETEKRLRPFLEKVGLLLGVPADGGKDTQLPVLLNDDELRWVFESPYMDDMCTDFMAPILRGALTPFESRGDALLMFWENQFGWKDIRQSNYITDSASKPLVIFNASNVDNGTRLAIGFPQLPRGLFPVLAEKPKEAEVSDSSAVNDAAQGEDDPDIDFAGAELPSAEFKPSRLAVEFPPQSLAEIFPNTNPNISLARAARFASNFPWGFRVLQLTREREVALDSKPNDDAASASKPLRILDGGIVDNTGLDTIRHLFDALRRQGADAYPWRTQSREPQDDSEYAAAILTLLHRRGVIVVEIDAGAKPVASQAPPVLSWVLNPLQSHLNALYANASLSESSHYEAMRNELSPTLDAIIAHDWNSHPEMARKMTDDQLMQELVAYRPLPMTTMLQCQLICNDVNTEASNVMTAWALGPSDKAIVIVQFLKEFVAWQEAVRRNDAPEADAGKSISRNVSDARQPIYHEAQRFYLSVAERRLAYVAESLKKTAEAVNKLQQAIAPIQDDPQDSEMARKEKLDAATTIILEEKKRYDSELAFVEGLLSPLAWHEKRISARQFKPQHGDLKFKLAQYREDQREMDMLVDAVRSKDTSYDNLRVHPGLVRKAENNIAYLLQQTQTLTRDVGEQVEQQAQTAAKSRIDLENARRRDAYDNISKSKFFERRSKK